MVPQASSKRAGRAQRFLLFFGMLLHLEIDVGVFLVCGPDLVGGQGAKCLPVTPEKGWPAWIKYRVVAISHPSLVAHEYFAKCRARCDGQVFSCPSAQAGNIGKEQRIEGIVAHDAHRTDGMFSWRIALRVYVFGKERSEIGTNRTRKPVEPFGSVTAARKRHTDIAEDSGPCGAPPISAPMRCIKSQRRQESAVEFGRIVEPLHHGFDTHRSEEHTSELQSRQYLVC